MNRICSHMTSNKAKKVVFVLAVLSILITFTAAGSSCSMTEKPSTVILELTPKLESLAQPVAFNEKDSQVLRCVSITENTDNLSVVVTKAKSDKIKSLIFVNQADLENSGSSSTVIAWVNVLSGEGNYDMSSVIYRTVNTSSLASAITEFGLTYDNWLTGSLSQEELFPCCK